VFRAGARACLIPHPTPMRVLCRLETPEDELFIRRLMMKTLACQLAAHLWPDEVRETLLDAQYRIRREGFRSGDGNIQSVIVLIERERVAWYVTSELDDEVRLVSLVVQSEHCGKGIGSAILRQLLDAADRSGKTVRLSVAMNNPGASELYSRLGFHRTGGDGTHYAMERPPQ
jgi:ribosomal protein S18 acetylase RimI-like enzyme